MKHAQVLMFEPDLGHSFWNDYHSRHRSEDALVKHLKKLVKGGWCHGWRIITIHIEVKGETK